MNHRQIILLWPNARALATDIGEKYETVRKWRFRNSIPANRWLDIVEAGRKRGFVVTLESLASKAAA